MAPHEKIVNALVYLARQSGQESLNKLKAIKLLYFADRYHIRKYGRAVTNDQYFGMKLGPVGSIAKDITELSDVFEDTELAYLKSFIQRVGLHEFKVARDFDRMAFSESDIEALNFSIKYFSRFDKYALAELSHAYPEWQKYERKLEDTTRFPMMYEDFFSDPIANDPYLKKYTEGKDFFSPISNPKALDIFISTKLLEKAWQ